MKIDLSGGDLGVLRGLVFIALTDARSSLVSAHISLEKSELGLAAYEQASVLVGRLEELLEKLEVPNA